MKHFRPNVRVKIAVNVVPNAPVIEMIDANHELFELSKW